MQLEVMDCTFRGEVYGVARVAATVGETPAELIAVTYQHHVCIGTMGIVAEYLQNVGMLSATEAIDFLEATLIEWDRNHDYTPGQPLNGRLLSRGRDLLLQACNEHDAHCVDPACDHSANVAAWIAHSLGVETKAAKTAMELLLDRYNAECAHCTNRN